MKCVEKNAIAHNRCEEHADYDFRLKDYIDDDEEDEDESDDE